MGRYLKCRDCDEIEDFPANRLCYAASSVIFSKEEQEDWGYEFLPNPIEVLTREIWCGVCNRPSFAERIPTELEFDNALGLVRRRNGPSGMELPEDMPSDPLLDLAVPTLLFLAQGLSGRKGPGACLWCGGRSYMPLSGPPLFGSGEEISHLRHEGCGGTFKYYHPFWIGSSTRRFAPKDGDGKEPRWYDFEGNLLVQSYYPFESHHEQAA